MCLGFRFRGDTSAGGVTSSCNGQVSNYIVAYKIKILEKKLGIQVRSSFLSQLNNENLT